MSEANVQSIEAVANFKRALFKFAEAANAALTDAEADMSHVYRWLETEQRTYWLNQVRKSTELVSRCEDALRQKRIFKDSSGRTPSAVDEEKALAKAKRMKEIAEEKVENVRRYTPKLQREIMLYKGQVQRFATFVAADIPAAAAKLDKMVDSLEAYVNLAAIDASVETPPVSQPSDEVISMTPEAPIVDSHDEPAKES
ncbi:MAG: hypothetical protein QOE14_1357 [Humisphaera sp.]|nr:hypothetical protein [Humisphaera sp.]